MLIVLLVINLLSIVACHVLASRKGANPVRWGLWGGIFGPLAIPFVLIA